jgi:integrase
MPKQVARKPWFRKQDGWWYGQVGSGRRGRRHVRLCQGEDKAALARKLYRKQLGDGCALELSPDSRLKDLFKAFLTKHSKVSCSPDTHKWYRHFLRHFARAYGKLRASRLTPLQVTDWLNSKEGWGETTRNRAVTCLTVALNWAVKMKVLRENPIKGIDKGSVLPRDRLVAPEERRLVLSSIRDRAFKLLVFAMVTTGARPSEIRRVTAREYMPPGLWVFPPRRHKTGKKTKKPRVVYLTPPMQKLCERLIRERTEGPLFLNSRGKPWTANALRCRFRRLRDKFPALAGVTAYCYRHTYCTDGLLNGVPLAQMQELMGHTSPAMMAHYAHLGQQAAAMREAAARATHRPAPQRRPRPA